MDKWTKQGKTTTVWRERETLFLTLNTETNHYLCHLAKTINNSTNQMLCPGSAANKDAPSTYAMYSRAEREGLSLTEWTKWPKQETSPYESKPI